MTFNIIKNAGRAMKATTGQGITVSRSEQLFIPEWGAFINCTPYEEHFIYENPDKSEGVPSYLCTCGSVAVITPAGPQGMFVCHFHATYQQHQTSVVDKKDWHKNIGAGTVRVKKGKKWG